MTTIKKYITYCFALCLFLTACEEAIDVNLTEVDDQFVIDAWLNNTETTQTIRVSQTQFYFDSLSTPGIADALVSIESSTGEIFEFVHEDNGNYIWTPTAVQPSLGIIGTSYNLTVALGGDEFTASTTLFPVPEIDSIDQEFYENDIFKDDGIYTQFFSRDIEGLGNTYWIKTFKNDRFLNRPEEINIAFDAGFDSGGEVDNLIFIPPIRDLTNEIDDEGFQVAWQTGEIVRIEIHSISNDAFNFMEILRDQLLNGSNGIFAEPLANTQGNISSTGDSEVLGVFNVAAIASREAIIE